MPHKYTKDIVFASKVLVLGQDKVDKQQNGALNNLNYLRGSLEKSSEFHDDFQEKSE